MNALIQRVRRCELSEVEESNIESCRLQRAQKED